MSAPSIDKIAIPRLRGLTAASLGMTTLFRSSCMPRSVLHRAFVVLAIVATSARAQTTLPAPAEPPRQTEADAYTRYELLARASAKFRIIYEVSATTAGA